MSQNDEDARVAELIAEAEAVEAAVQEAVREALLDHKRAGNPVVGWHNGRLEWVSPEKILADDPQADV
jgi:hypothetical protein